MLIHTRFRKVPVISMGRSNTLVRMSVMEMEGGNIFNTISGLFSGTPKLLSRLFSGTNLKQAGRVLLNSALETGKNYLENKGNQILSDARDMIINNPGKLVSDTTSLIRNLSNNPQKVIKQETDKLANEILRDVVKPVKNSVKKSANKTKKQVKKNAMDILYGMGHDHDKMGHDKKPIRRKKVMDMMGRGLIPY